MVAEVTTARGGETDGASMISLIRGTLVAMDIKDRIDNKTRLEIVHVVAMREAVHRIGRGGDEAEGVSQVILQSYMSYSVTGIPL